MSPLFISAFTNCIVYSAYGDNISSLLHTIGLNHIANWPQKVIRLISEDE